MWSKKVMDETAKTIPVRMITFEASYGAEITQAVAVIHAHSATAARCAMHSLMRQLAPDFPRPAEPWPISLKMMEVDWDRRIQMIACFKCHGWGSLYGTNQKCPDCQGQGGIILPETVAFKLIQTPRNLL
jgi:hypothetical protein